MENDPDSVRFCQLKVQTDADQFVEREKLEKEKNEIDFTDAIIRATELCNKGHRPDYDYIQTQGCNIEGQIPAADKAKINALFDAGITIWHERDGSNRYGLFADSDHTNKNFT